MAASAVYIFNDIVDRQADRLHPEKCKRPVAAGQVDVASAAGIAVVCGLVAVVGSFALARAFGYIIVAYLGLMVAYSLFLRRLLILDCVVIAIGFCLRAVAGAVVVGVFISPWLVICTFALCLFMAFSKRRGEVAELREDSELFRETLASYTPELLGHMIDVTSGLAVACFLLYAMDERTSRLFGTNNLVYTTPIVLYCIFRFSALIQQGRYSSPVDLIMRDRPFQVGVVVWVLACALVVYANRFVSVFGNIWAY